MVISSSDIAFSESVKSVQKARGSRELNVRIEAAGGFRTLIDSHLTAAFAEANSVYLVTASSAGQPYAQHRGGPRGFIRIIDDHTIGFVDVLGNRQYITTGNLQENPKAFIFLMDYAKRRRFKIWGRARIVLDDITLIEQLMPDGSTAQAQAAILFEIVAWDTNCPRHIPKKLDADLVADLLAQRDAEIARLTAELAALRTTAARQSQ